ncbi:hypothetical protein ACRALDRAFT_1072617 [Sodiomyces alcalophilus JCM 7366]|uniref:uncharacterized protein n=1 Tax=Sodiomyces alcalophilus JCM 7366 TaxID=591952 RepID=UPI0039B6A040
MDPNINRSKSSQGDASQQRSGHLRREDTDSTKNTTSIPIRTEKQKLPSTERPSGGTRQQEGAAPSRREPVTSGATPAAPSTKTAASGPSEPAPTPPTTAPDQAGASTQPAAPAVDNDANTTTGPAAAPSEEAQGGNNALSGFTTHTSTDPSRSVNSYPYPQPHFSTYLNPAIHNNTPQTHIWSPAAPFAHSNLAPAAQGNANPLFYHPVPPQVSQQKQRKEQVNMGDYQTPRPDGLHFQPPVPDTTYGPMTHLYVPRFDNGGVAVYSQQPQPNNVTVIGQAPQPVNNGPPLIFATQQMPGLMQGPIPAPAHVQHVLLNGVPVVQVPQPAMGMAGPPGATFVAQKPQFPPDITGIGRTAAEVAMENAEYAYNNGLYEPQDFKPQDDDPSRYYPVRELDGNWTQRNRFTIDNLGDCRWYVTDTGYFYAVRLPN